MKTISGYSRVGGCKLRWTAPCLAFLSACGVGTEEGRDGEPQVAPTASTDDSFSSDPTASDPTSVVVTTSTAGVSPDVPGSTSDATSGTTESSTTSAASGTSEPTPIEVDDGRPGRTLIRRLSNQEYGATIRTLLADDTDYAESFPADTAVNGFTNNTDVQDVAPALAEQYMVAAEAISQKAVENVDALLGCPISEGAACVSTFIADFGKKAWRRPLSSSEQTALLALFQSEPEAATGVRLVLQALLVSPSFLYRTEVGVPVVGQTYAALSSWEMASRLSYFLTGTMPDAELFAAAEADELRTPAQIETHARRLLGTDAARKQVADFFSGWLNLRALDRLERDSEQFPGWDSNLPLVFHDETRTFATHVVFDAGFDLNTLLTAPFTYGDPSLAAYYGGTIAEESNGEARIDLPPNERAGLLTQASFLATHAKEIQTDPVARGKFVRERILCQGIPSPPADLIISAPEITPGSTTRERFAQHEAEPSCAACHVLIDPIGLAFEHYDPIGQWRDTEDGETIDASGELIGSDVLGAYEGVVQMSAKLAESAMVSECFVRYWFRFTFGRGESDSESARMKTIARTFFEREQRVQELLIAMTQTPDFLYLAKEAQP